MTILEFFNLCAGEWMCHRTRHDLAVHRSEAGRSKLAMEIQDPTDPVVVRLCEAHGQDPSRALLGLKLSWSGQLDHETRETKGNAFLVVFPDPEANDTGLLLPERGSVGHYRMGLDETLVMTMKTEAFELEERIWFASPNLRMRVSFSNGVTPETQGHRQASLTSEIRKLSAPPPTPQETPNTAAV